MTPSKYRDLIENAADQHLGDSTGEYKIILGIARSFRKNVANTWRLFPSDRQSTLRRTPLGVTLLGGPNA